MAHSKCRSLIKLFLAVSIGAFMAHSVVAQSKVTSMPTDIPRSYFAVSDGTPATYGETLKLSRKSASFSKLKGKMKLQYSDVWNNGKDTEFGGDVYKVLNADEFFSLNKSTQRFCDQPVKWVTIKDTSALLGDGTVRIGMLTVDDWHKYSPTSLGACSADTYKLK